MIFLNPQWQGAGDVHDLVKGAHTLAAFATASGFMDEADVITVPLSQLPLDTVNEIAAYQPSGSIIERAAGLVNKNHFFWKTYIS